MLFGVLDSLLLAFYLSDVADRLLRLGKREIIFLLIMWFRLGGVSFSTFSWSNFIVVFPVPSI